MNIKSIQLIKSGWLALSLVVIASMTGGWFATNSSASANQSQAPDINKHDTGKKSGMMQHSGRMEHGDSNTTTPNSAEMPGMMQHGGGMMDHSMAMDNGPADEFYDLRFIDAMRLHHRGAIAMAKEAEQKSQRPEIKKLARNIIVAQNREENELLRKWRRAWYPQAPEEPVAYSSQEKSTVPMSKELQQNMTMAMDLGSADAQFDLRFMNAMIAHHEGAVTMAEDALKKSQRPEVKQLSQEIINSQQAEINQMKKWRQVWYQKSGHSM